MTDVRQIEILDQGVDAWNTWRRQNPDIPMDLMDQVLTGRMLHRVNLSGANLIGVNLDGADLSESELEGACLNTASMNRVNLFGANLSGAYMLFTQMNDADLAGANLSRANLEKAEMQRSELYKTNFDETNLTDANLTGSDLSGAIFTGTILIGANLSNTNVTDLVYDRHRMPGKYKGICVDSCYGYAVFKRDAQDQDYIDTLWASAKSQCSLYCRVTAAHQWLLEGWRKMVGCKWMPAFKYIHSVYTWICSVKHKRRRPLQIIGIWFWGFLTDYGRSIPRLCCIAAVVIALFGYYYQTHPELLSINTSTPAVPSDVQGGTLRQYLFGESETSGAAAMSGFTPYYFSVVIFTTLGLGDITAHGTGGQVAIVLEVILGYVNMGLLLSILGNKVARRS